MTEAREIACADRAQSGLVQHGVAAALCDLGSEHLTNVAYAQQNDRFALQPLPDRVLRMMLAAILCLAAYTLWIK